MYYPYPDDSVNFAFSLDPRSTTEKDYFYSTYETRIKQLQALVEESDWKKFVSNSRINLILYPVGPLSEELFRWFAEAQVLQQLQRSQVKEEKLPLISRIHPGSPHMYWSHLWQKESEGKEFYELTNRPLTYSPLQNKILLPLHDKLGTRLVSSLSSSKVSPSLSSLSSSRVSPSLSSSSSKVSPSLSFSLSPVDDVRQPYCGDVQALWEKEYISGNVGDFQKCKQLYLQQTALAHRLFPSSKLAPQEMPKEIIAQEHDDPYLSFSRALSQRLTDLTVVDEELKQEIEESKKFVAEFGPLTRSTDNKQDLQWEQEALNWQLKNLTTQLETARKNYREKQQELYQLEKLPFIRKK